MLTLILRIRATSVQVGRLSFQIAYVHRCFLPVEHVPDLGCCVIRCWWNEPALRAIIQSFPPSGLIKPDPTGSVRGGLPGPCVQTVLDGQTHKEPQCSGKNATRRWQDALCFHAGGNSESDVSFLKKTINDGEKSALLSPRLLNVVGGFSTCSCFLFWDDRAFGL